MQGFTSLWVKKGWRSNNLHFRYLLRHEQDAQIGHTRTGSGLGDGTRPNGWNRMRRRFLKTFPSLICLIRERRDSGEWQIKNSSFYNLKPRPSVGGLD